jgi:hypothetical protein
MIKQKYLKTNSMAELIGYSGDFLLKNRNILFFENVHYFSKGLRINWKVSEVVSWVENKNMSHQAKSVLDTILS